MALRSVLAPALLSLASGCALMPREVNLSPVWFHRCDAEGQVLEWDCCWPLLHYERTPEGGDDFRVRPFYRRVTEPELEAIEHQFLWPLGRVRVYPEQTIHRLFPFWSWRSRENEDGGRDVDWYAGFPFVWGGHSADGREDYFAVLPFFGSIPDFLTYDRFRTLLFPLYVNVDKGGHRHHLVLWPLIGFSTCAEGDHAWFRVAPLYGHDIEQGRHDRRFLMWPFFTWSTENQDTAGGPVHAWSFWPFFGWRSGRDVTGWHVLWPFFQWTQKRGSFATLNLLWPFFKHHWSQSENTTQWWLWPFVSRVTSDDQRTWTFAWPLVWWRQYDDLGEFTTQRWVLPFFWNIDIALRDGSTDRYWKAWPFAHGNHVHDADGAARRGDWSVPSPWPNRGGLAYGIEEAYGWIWELVRGVTRARDDKALELAGRLYSGRERADGASSSVPFLFNYERDRDGARTLRLLQFLPIPLGRAESEPAPSPAR